MGGSILMQKGRELGRQLGPTESERGGRDARKAQLRH
jgi:hypothetical protein